MKVLRDPTDWIEMIKDGQDKGGAKKMGTGVWVAIGIAIAAALGLFGKSKKKK